MSLTLLPRMDQASKTLDSHNLVASLVRLHPPPPTPQIVHLPAILCRTSI